MALEKNVADKYEILDQELGKGAWSVVQKCRPIPPYFPEGFPPETCFVVKIIAKSHLLKLAGPENEARAMNDVQREIDTLKNIPPHPSIVKFVEHFETLSHFLLIFEEVSGGDLCELILNLQGKIKLEDARRYLYQIILALIQCHSSNVAHRDVKPENLLVDGDNNIKLTDFGLAKRVKDAPPDATDPLSVDELMRPYAWLAKRSCVCTDIIGTPRYGAPEMFAAKFSKQTYDAFLADTWSVGIVGYILLTGSFPFSVRDKQNPTERDTYNAIMETNPVYPSSPELGVHLVKQLLQKDPTKRIRLHEAIDHPWFEGLWQDGSLVVDKARSQPPEGIIKSSQEQLLRDFEAEARALRLALRKLRGDALRRRDVTPVPTSTATKRASSSGRPSSLSSGVRSSTPNTRSLQSPMPSPARVPLAGTSTPTGPRARSPAVGVSSRVDSKDSTTARRSATPISTPAARGASPLARSNPVAVRRGTPARPLTTPGSAAAPSPTRPSASSVSSGIRSSTPVGAAITRGTPLSSARAPTPSGRTTPSSGLGMPRAPTPTRPKTATVPSKVAAPSPKASNLVSSARSLAGSSSAGFTNGEIVLYNGQRAVVHFSGITTFGPGSWLGIEMLDADGTNDGTSHVDKKRYFTCPKGKGVFVRPQQVMRLPQ